MADKHLILRDILVKHNQLFITSCNEYELDWMTVRNILLSMKSRIDAEKRDGKS